MYPSHAAMYMVPIRSNTTTQRAAEFQVRGCGDRVCVSVREQRQVVSEQK